MTRRFGPALRLSLICLFAIAVASCETSGQTDTRSSIQVGAPAAQALASGALAATQSPEIAQKRHFIEFRSRYALSYGHSFVIFGELDQAGNMINPEVAGLHPASDSVVPYMLGHVLPVPAETGWSDGDLEDEYMSANWRVMLDESEYRRVLAYIRGLQKNSRTWHAALYNCNAFVADIARFMGYKTPFIWLKPRDFITKLREMNGGPNAIGVTRPAA
ncbi:hypothetical protein [Chelativorans sp.]|uniref:hypothetical protein n=1 Tax=Chelativorans sp. TaxID=2203393 RepID=UPI0028123BC3|nr:hypothetical protein [Chelativorans sp.]